MTERQTRNQLDGANVKSAARGRWPLQAAVRGILADARRNRDADALAQARAREMHARARRQEIAVAEKSRELIPLEEANFVTDLIVRFVVDELDGIAARVTRDLELRRKIEADVRGVRQRAAARLQTEAARLRAGGEIDIEAAE